MTLITDTLVATNSFFKLFCPTSAKSAITLWIIGHSKFVNFGFGLGAMNSILLRINFGVKVVLKKVWRLGLALIRNLKFFY